MDESKECPICMQRSSKPILTGCDHSFCETCIVSWTTGSRSFCPICERPIYGIQTACANARFLPPHNGKFGLTLKQAQRALKIVSVEENSIAQYAGIRPEMEVSVNDHSDMKNAYKVLEDALKYKRMVRIKHRDAQEEKRKSNVCYKLLCDMIIACRHGMTSKK